MTAAPEATPEDPFASLEREVDEAIACCEGDARATVRALLVTMRFHEEQIKTLKAAVSSGYARGLFHPLLTPYGWMRGLVDSDGEPE